MVQDHVQVLQTFPGHRIHSVADKFFTLGLQAMAEDWRRFQYVTAAYPFALFAFIEFDDETFLMECANLQEKTKQCPSCVDTEFTQPLLDYIQKGPGESVAHRIAQVKALLITVATYAPISSDIVECLHGYCQQLIRTGGRGVRPTDEGAQERVVWALLTKAYEKLRSLAWDNFADAKALRRMVKFGRTSSNQYTDPSERSATVNGGRKPALTLEKMDRALLFDGGSSCVGKSRKLCGDLFEPHDL